jgi:hypothetical protein
VRTETGDFEIALREVTFLGAVNIAPTLDSCVDLNDLIRAHQRCTYWTPDTMYDTGAIIMPSVPNGRRYSCLQAGTSGMTEPNWPLGTNVQMVDNDFNWIEDGPDYPNCFDIGWAVYDVWMYKAGQASAQVDVTLAGGAAAGTFAVKCAQQFEHCITMAQRYQPVRF